MKVMFVVGRLWRVMVMIEGCEGHGCGKGL